MDCSALASAELYERLNKDPALWWVICGVEFGAGKPKAFVQLEGGSNLEDLKSHLSDDAIQYGCFKVLGVDTKGAITSTRTKFVRGPRARPALCLALPLPASPQRSRPHAPPPTPTPPLPPFPLPRSASSGWAPA